MSAEGYRRGLYKYPSNDLFLMSVIAKADVPDDPSQWEEGTIIECIGTPDEHEDKFYRSGNWGIEEHDDGQFQIYAIVDEEPIMVRDQMNSFEECVAFIRENGEKKALGDEAPAEEGELEEEVPAEEEEIPEDLPEVAEEEAPAEEEEEAPAEEPPVEEEDEEEEAPVEEEEESEKTEKSFRSMMQARDMRKSYVRPAGMMNRNCNALRKTSSNEGGVGQYLRKSTDGYKYKVINTGTDKDYCGMGEDVGNGETNAEGVSKKKVDASVAGLKKSSDRMSIREMIAFKKSGGSFAKMPTVQTKIDSNPEFGAGNAWEMESQAMNTIRDEPGTVASDFAEGDIDNADSGIMMDVTPVGPADGVQTAKPITEQPGAQTGDTEPTAVDEAMTQEAPNPELVSEEPSMDTITEESTIDIAPAPEAPVDAPTEESVPDETLGEEEPELDDNMSEPIALSAKTPSELPMRELMEFKKSGMDFETFKKKFFTQASIDNNNWKKLKDSNDKVRESKKKLKEASKRAKVADATDKELDTPESHQYRRKAYKDEDEANSAHSRAVDRNKNILNTEISSAPTKKSIMDRRKPADPMWDRQTGGDHLDSDKQVDSMLGKGYSPLQIYNAYQTSKRKFIDNSGRPYSTYPPLSATAHKRIMDGLTEEQRRQIPKHFRPREVHEDIYDDE